MRMGIPNCIIYGSVVCNCVLMSFVFLRFFYQLYDTQPYEITVSYSNRANKGFLIDDRMKLKYEALLTSKPADRSQRITVSGQENWMTNFQESLIVMDSPSMVYCGIPRIGCSRWKRLLRKMEGYTDYFEQQPHNHYRNGLKHSTDILPNKMEEVLNNPDYFRFVIVRDPFSRLLSAWMAKRNNTAFPVKLHHKFANFVRNVTLTLLEDPTGAALNHHFRPMSQFCGLSSMKFDFEGRLEDLAEWGPLLIKRIGAEKEAASGWPDPNDTFLGSSRSMGSLPMSASSLLHEFYSPVLIDLISKAFASDLVRFNYTTFARKLREESVRRYAEPSPLPARMYRIRHKPHGKK